METFTIILAGFIVVAGFVCYVKSLVNAAKNAKWVWFVLMLLMWPIFLLYVLVVYESVSESSYSE